VAWTALDARKAGFEAYVIEDACRGIDTQGSLAKAWADMAKAGVKRIQSSDIAVYFRSGGFILRDAADTPLFRMRS
jgi:nicotinamidase/pyrazinamidase